MSLWAAEKRLLALDGGGVRGIVTIAFLEQIEAQLKAQSGKGDAFRLCDHFDLIGGTSTGAIIAAGLAAGRTVAQIRALYEDLAPRVFRRYWWRVPYVQSRFGPGPLARILAQEFGDIALDAPALRTHLAIVMKRVDTGSPWIVSTLPGQPYWEDRADGQRPGNRHFKLVNLVRASTAAPYYFGPERIPISADVVGHFVDGGVSPYNSPVLPVLMLATMHRYGLSWPLGPERLSMVSIGTGRHRHRVTAGRAPALLFAVNSLHGLIEDCQAMSLMLMQWLSEGDAPWFLNRDLEALEGDQLAGKPLLSFQRYDMLLESDWLEVHCGTRVEGKTLKRLRRLDGVGAMGELYALAREAAKAQVRPAS